MSQESAPWFARAWSMRGLLRLCEVVGWCTAILLAIGNVYSAAIALPHFAEIFKDFSAPLPAAVVFMLKERWILVGIACTLAVALVVAIRRHSPELFVAAIMVAILAQFVCTWAPILSGVTEIGN